MVQSQHRQRERQGYAFNVSGQHDESFAEYRKAIDLKPNYDQAYNNLGYGLASAGRYDEAIPYLEKALSIQPNNSDYLDSMGFALAGKGQYDMALAKYQQALKSAPNTAIIHLHVAQTLEKLGRTTEASGEFETAYRLDPQLKSQPK